MPEDYQKYLEWDAKRFLDWGTKIGPATVACLKAVLASHKIEQQAYRCCMGLLKLADKHSVAWLEASATKALTYTSTPSFKNIKNVFLSGLDKPDSEPDSKDSSESTESLASEIGSFKLVALICLTGGSKCVGISKGENPIGFLNKYFFKRIKCHFVILRWYYFIS